MATRLPSKRPARKAAPTPVSPRRHGDAPDQSARVVGIGASAGGLDPFIELVSSIPLDTGLACVLIHQVNVAPAKPEVPS
jgi:chemotaxis response regulator CheB